MYNINYILKLPTGEESEYNIQIMISGFKGTAAKCLHCCVKPLETSLLTKHHYIFPSTLYYCCIMCLFEITPAEKYDFR